MKEKTEFVKYIIGTSPVEIDTEDILAFCSSTEYVVYGANNEKYCNEIYGEAILPSTISGTCFRFLMCPEGETEIAVCYYDGLDGSPQH